MIELNGAVEFNDAYARRDLRGDVFELCAGALDDRTGVHVAVIGQARAGAGSDIAANAGEPS